MFEKKNKKYNFTLSVTDPNKYVLIRQNPDSGYPHTCFRSVSKQKR